MKLAKLFAESVSVLQIDKYVTYKSIRGLRQFIWKTNCTVARK